MQATRPVVETVFRKLGGREVLGQKVTSEADLARLVHRRIPLRALIYVKRGGFSDQEIGRFIIPERTQRHRKAKRQPLTVEESDRVVRLMRIQALTEDVFGDVEKANRWLRENLAILDGKAPLEVARTESAPVSSSRCWRRSTGAQRPDAPLAVIEPATRSRLRWGLRAREQRPLEYSGTPSNVLFDGSFAHRVGETRTCYRQQPVTASGHGRVRRSR